MANDRTANPSLTPREREIVRLVVQGKKRSTIASTLGVHLNTVDFHLINVRRKLHVCCIVEVAVWGAGANGSL